MTLTVIDGRLSSKNIAAILQSYNFNVADEKQMQKAIAGVLTENNIPFSREVEIAQGDIVDFMVGKIGIEIKIGFSYNAVITQLHRYSMSDEVVELMLVTTRVQHQMPSTIGNKKLTTVNLGMTNSLGNYILDSLT